jgi:hypothetical protein
MQVIGVCPSGADSLIAGNINRAAVPILTGSWNGSAQPLWIGVSVEHTEAPFGGFPDKPGGRVYQLVEGVVPEVIMIVARREFKKSIASSDVLVRVADKDIAVANVGSRHSEADQLMNARRYAALFDTAKARGQVFHANDPVVPEHIRADD